MENVLTVSQINNYLKSKIDNDFKLKNITIKGEISNFTNHIKSGHFYFTVKDNNASIKAIMFKTYASKVDFDVQNGMEVLLKGTIKFFERDGIVQFYCEKMEQDGIGNLYMQFEKLKAKLEKEGLFDSIYKKPIPKTPNVIGVVTSKTSAALQDIINILSRRYPLAKLIVIDALVQGKDAPKSIKQGIKLANTYQKIDVLIVGRGGGSIEDLWAFNDEEVAREIFNSQIPIISAVGHEIDFTIADFVADLRAPTPSAAAEICCVDINDIKLQIDSKIKFLHQFIEQRINLDRQSKDKLLKQLNLLSPQTKMEQTKQKLSDNIDRLNILIAQNFKIKEKEYLSKLNMLKALSPLTVLSRGYSVTFASEKVISSSKQVAKNDIIKTKLNDGQIISKVMEVE